MTPDLPGYTRSGYAFASPQASDGRDLIASAITRLQMLPAP
jgi:hypothetical protein